MLSAAFVWLAFYLYLRPSEALDLRGSTVGRPRRGPVSQKWFLTIAGKPAKNNTFDDGVVCRPFGQDWIGQLLCALCLLRDLPLLFLEKVFEEMARPWFRDRSTWVATRRPVTRCHGPQGLDGRPAVSRKWAEYGKLPAPQHSAPVRAETTRGSARPCHSSQSAPFSLSYDVLECLQLCCSATWASRIMIVLRHFAGDPRLAHRKTSWSFLRWACHRFHGGCLQVPASISPTRGDFSLFVRLPPHPP